MVCQELGMSLTAEINSISNNINKQDIQEFAPSITMIVLFLFAPNLSEV